VLKTATGSRNKPSVATIMNFISGHISAAYRDIRTKFGVCVENWASEASIWSKSTSDHIQDRGRLNRDNSATDWLILSCMQVHCRSRGRPRDQNREQLAGRTASSSNAALIGISSILI